MELLCHQKILFQFFSSSFLFILSVYNYTTFVRKRLRRRPCCCFLQLLIHPDFRQASKEDETDPMPHRAQSCQSKSYFLEDFVLHLWYSSRPGSCLDLDLSPCTNSPPPFQFLPPSFPFLEILFHRFRRVDWHQLPVSNRRRINEPQAAIARYYVRTYDNKNLRRRNRSTGFGKMPQKLILP